MYWVPSNQKMNRNNRMDVFAKWLKCTWNPFRALYRGICFIIVFIGYVISFVMGKVIQLYVKMYIYFGLKPIWIIKSLHLFERFLDGYQTIILHALVCVIQPFPALIIMLIILTNWHVCYVTSCNALILLCNSPITTIPACHIVTLPSRWS